WIVREQSLTFYPLLHGSCWRRSTSFRWKSIGPLPTHEGFSARSQILRTSVNECIGICIQHTSPSSGILGRTVCSCGQIGDSCLSGGEPPATCRGRLDPRCAGQGELCAERGSGASGPHSGMSKAEPLCVTKASVRRPVGGFHRCADHESHHLKYLVP